MEDIEKVVEVLEVENDKAAAADPLIQKSLAIVHDFLKTHPVMCYGGTAINNLLPEADRFYDPVTTVPDYDFYSKTPQEHATIIANKLAEAGLASVEVKPGMHLGTFKVFADFTGVADITQMDDDLFERLWAEGIVREGIHYVPPNFLRLSMYLELSRPRGDVSRWTKVYTRLGLLNKHYPMVCPSGDPAEPAPLSERNRKAIEKLLRTKPVVLLGITASQIHERKKPKWSAPVTILAEPATLAEIVKGKKTEVQEGTEVLPGHTDVFDDDGDLLLRIHETAACHSYHQTSDGTRVASIPTMLQFYFAYMYSGVDKDELTHLLCVSQRLVDLAAHKEKRRYALLTPIDCIGTQETLIDMKKHKSDLYLKLSTNKGSAEFLKYFFSYNPRAPKTERTKLKDQLRRTRRNR
jgi:hypothetical protein